jgi:hypothetical protein
MSVLDVLTEKRQGSDGVAICFHVDTTTSDLMYPEDGVYTFITINGQEGHYGCFIPMEDYDERRIERFMDAFAAFPDWRKQWKDSENQETPRLTRQITIPAVPREHSALARDIKHLLKLGQKAKFKDYAALRSGRDEFSKMAADVLPTRVDEQAVQAVEAAMQGEGPEVHAKVYRWVLHGLPVEHAIHKVRVDQEIATNAGRGGR